MSKKNWQIQIATTIIHILVLCLKSTYRVRVFGYEHRLQAKRTHASGSFCIALWHEQLFAAILAHADQKFAPLASLSQDGEIVARVMNRLGFHTIRGSSSRGGEEARDELVEITEKGWFTALTIDGPRGPRRRVKGGVIDIARRSGVAVLPLISAADRQWILVKSWDQFKIPKPFARIAIRYGAPLEVHPELHGLAFGEAKATIKKTLDQIETETREDLAKRWSEGLPFKDVVAQEG